MKAVPWIAVLAVACITTHARDAAAGLCGAGSYECCPTPACAPSGDYHAGKNATTCLKTVQEVVYDKQEVTCTKTVYDTVCEQVPVTRTKHVYETHWRECQSVVCRPVVERSYKTCTFTVCKQVPVCESGCDTGCCPDSGCCGKGLFGKILGH